MKVGFADSYKGEAYACLTVDGDNFEDFRDEEVNEGDTALDFLPNNHPEMYKGAIAFLDSAVALSTEEDSVMVCLEYLLAKVYAMGRDRGKLEAIAAGVRGPVVSDQGAEGK